MAKTLIIRLSAIGDVAMTIPIIYSVARAHPEVAFTVLTQPFLTTLFIHRPENVALVGVDTKGAEHSLWGVVRLALRLTHERFDRVVDLHNVIRSRAIGLVFQLRGVPVYRLDKMRRERRALTARPPKTIRPLRPVTERYADVFRAAGLSFSRTFVSLFAAHPVDEAVISEMAGEKTGYWVGVAPFARHVGKIYPPAQMERVIDLLSGREDITLFLFGGKGDEQAVLDRWAATRPRVRSMAGRYTLNQELALISRLDVFLCMDSANMHFAALVGTPVVSVWGATHPFAGFYPYGLSPEDAIQEDLDCRPCSTFGDKPCHRGDWACMTRIAPERIVRRVVERLGGVKP